MTTDLSSRGPAKPAWKPRKPVVFGIACATILIFGAISLLNGFFLMHSGREPFVRTCGLLVIIGSLICMAGIGVGAGAVYFSKSKSR
jgi:hypothetical protein